VKTCVSNKNCLSLHFYANVFSCLHGMPNDLYMMFRIRISTYCLLGTYSPEKSGRSAHYSAPSYSLSSRSKGHKTDISPGEVNLVVHENYFLKRRELGIIYFLK